MQGEIYGINGPPRGGKSTVSEYMARVYGFRRYEMSTPIIDDVAQLFGQKGVTYEPEKKEEWRLLLQGWGHLARVELGENYWVDRVISTVIPPAVIGGIRYLNEIERLREMGGKVLRVERSNAGNNDTAVTEVQLLTYANFDAVLRNDGSLDDLYRQVDEMLKRFRS